jgi:DNA-binding NarL/FixJ family response regulator
MTAGLTVAEARPAAEGVRCLAALAGDAMGHRRIERALAGETGITILAAGLNQVVRPDVVVLACDPSTRYGVAEIRRLVQQLSPTSLVVVAPASTGQAVRRALAAGACGLVYDTEIEAALAPVVRAAVLGYLSIPRASQRCLERPELSGRERQVLHGAVLGRSNAEIAQELFLAESTVKSHLSAVFRKLGVHSRSEAAALVLDPEETLAPLVFGPQDGARV